MLDDLSHGLADLILWLQQIEIDFLRFQRWQLTAMADGLGMRWQTSFQRDMDGQISAHCGLYGVIRF